MNEDCPVRAMSGPIGRSTFWDIRRKIGTGERKREREKKWLFKGLEDTGRVECDSETLCGQKSVRTVQGRIDGGGSK
jgi:hypothetical protein